MIDVGVVLNGGQGHWMKRDRGREATRVDDRGLEK